MQTEAKLARIAYLSPEERKQEAMKLGYTVENQDADRALLVKDGKAVITIRGTTPKEKSNALRDLATDTAILFGQAEKTPRYIATDMFLQNAMNKGYSDISAVGHSLGAHQALYLGKKYGVKTTAFNPAFSFKDIAKSVGERITLGGKKYKNIEIYTTGTDPISFGSLLNISQDVKRIKPTKPWLSSHALEQFIN